MSGNIPGLHNILLFLREDLRQDGDTLTKDKWVQEERYKGFSYEQTIRTKAFPMDRDTLKTEAVLDDPDHHIEIYLIVSVNDRRILDAGAMMTRQPYPKCHVGMKKVKDVIGLKIRKGLYEKMGEQVSGREGCVHLFELLMTASRMSANAILSLTVGEKTWENITDRDDEFHGRLMGKLKGMCIGFNKDVLEGKG